LTPLILESVSLAYERQLESEPLADLILSH